MELMVARELADQLLLEHLAERRARANQVILIAELAEHYVLPAGAEVTHPVLVDALAEEVFDFGGPGAPNISEFAALEIAALLRISRRRATVMIQGAVHLKWQLPELYDQVERLIIDADRAVQASYAVAELPPPIAVQVIARWVQVQERYSWTGAFNKLDEMIAEADPRRSQASPARGSEAGRAAELCQQSKHRGVADVGADSSFQRWVDLGQEAADPVRDPVDFACQVVIPADPAQRMGHRTACLSDDVGVAGVGFRVARMQISDTTHRQSGQVGDLDAHRSSHRHGQSTDRGGLVHDHQHRPMADELGEHLPQRRLILRKRLVMDPLSHRVESRGMVVFYADVETDEHVEPV